MQSNIKSFISSDLIDLAPDYSLFLKPIARASITVQVPGVHVSNGQSKSFSTWEIIEKLRQLAPTILSPPTQIKVLRTTLEFVRFIAELENRADVKRVVTSLDSQYIKLSGFPQNLCVRASEAPSECPRRHDWESFFRDAADMDETKPGERPDTIVLHNLPVRWFVESISTSSETRFNENVDERPSPTVIQEAFKSFGSIRAVDIPMLDPAQNPKYVQELKNYLPSHAMKTATNSGIDSEATGATESGFGKIGPDTIRVVSELQENEVSGNQDSFNRSIVNKLMGSLTFTAYVQYTDYTGFSRAMEALRCMKLVYAPNRGALVEAGVQRNKLYFTAEFKLDFDRSKHLSHTAIQRRTAIRRPLLLAAQRRKADEKASLDAEAERKRREADEELERRRLNLEVEEKARERRKAEAMAVEAERVARLAQKAERKRRKAIERCRAEKDALLKKKIWLEDRRRILALRKVQALRLLSFLLDKVQTRHDEAVAARHSARFARAAARAKAAEDAAQAITIASVSKHHKHQDSEITQSDERRSPASSSTTSSSANGELDMVESQSETEDISTALRQKLLQKKEERLRATLLDKRSSMLRNKLLSKYQVGNTWL